MDGRERFNQLLEEIRDTFNRKNAGYAGESNPDPWANFRHSEGFGIPASSGVLVRISDKFARLQSLTRDPNNDRVGESRRDSALDMAVYNLIYVCLLEEEEQLTPVELVGTAKTRVWITHESGGSNHWSDEPCYAAEKHMTFSCIPGN